MARVVFLGSPDFAVPSLEALAAAGHDVVAVVTQPDREAGRGRTISPPAVKVAAHELGIPVLQPPSLRPAAAVEQLAAYAPDLIVVAAFGQILRPPVLGLPRHGVVNVHASLLPRWRGASPVTAAILAGDRETGVTIMQVDEGMDTGAVLARRAVLIHEQDTGGTLTDRLARLGAEVLIETLPAWLAGGITVEPQDGRHATYAHRLAKEAGRLDWSRPAAELWRAVRAHTPWPGAFTEYRGGPLRILSAAYFTHAAAAEPGTVLGVPGWLRDVVPPELPNPAFAVATGAGLLMPLKLQRAGKRPVFAEEFEHGERGLIGSRLGV